MSAISSAPSSDTKEISPVSYLGRYVASTESFEDSVGGPIKELTTQIRWYHNEEEIIGYKPYLVQVVAIDGDLLDFFFINQETGVAFGNRHSLNLSDLRVVYRDSPSTLPDAAQFYNGL